MLKMYLKSLSAKCQWPQEVVEVAPARAAFHTVPRPLPSPELCVDFGGDSARAGSGICLQRIQK